MDSLRARIFGFGIDMRFDGSLIELSGLLLLPERLVRGPPMILDAEEPSPESSGS